MAREAFVKANTCTWCLMDADVNVLGEVPIHFTYTALENGGFSFSYNPDGDEAKTAYACDHEHAEDIVEKLGAFANWVEARIVKPVEYEERYDLPVEELPEGFEEKEKEEAPTPEGDAKALLEKMGKRVGADGVKVVPTSPDLQDRINSAAARVQNPKPDQVGPADPPDAIEEWQTWFEDGYEPSDDQPAKGDEKDACKAWFDKLPPGRRLNLAPKGWPVRGSLARRLCIEWHKSRAYADFLESVNA